MNSEILNTEFAKALAYGSSSWTLELKEEKISNLCKLSINKGINYYIFTKVIEMIHYSFKLLKENLLSSIHFINLQY